MAKKDKKRNKEELDMETTIADMNVEGFSWYDPRRKNRTQPMEKLTKEEQRAMIRGAFRAMLPMLGCIIAVGLFMMLLVYLWLK